MFNLKLDLSNLEKETYVEGFWLDRENSQNVLQKIKIAKNKIESYENLFKDYEDLQALLELALDENDSTLFKEIENLFYEFTKNFDKYKLKSLLVEEYDKNNAIITLHSGAGGTDACDWVSILFRMYTRFAQKYNYKVEILDYLDGEEAGIKSVTIQISGENAFGYLKSEKGVHRLVRISPFDSSGKRHTSFASCDVMPELDDNIEVLIDEEDLKIDTYRASGAGGQHVNKTESAVRVTHIPTNIVAQCQSERSQHKNKERALKVLKSKLFEKKQKEQELLLKDMRGEIKDISWGSQIRSYIFHPYNLVKDHRTNEEVGNIQSVVDGNIDVFINSYLKWINT